MKKIDIGQTIQILANIGVIAGIVFLAVEVQQANNAVQSSTLQAIGELSYGSARAIVENTELRQALQAARRGEDLTDDQEYMLFASYNGLMRIQQIRYQQLRLGVLSEDTIFEVGGTGPGYRNPYFQKYWTENSSQFSDEFRTFIEQCVMAECDAIPR
jgi:hypothetical protein